MAPRPKHTTSETSQEMRKRIMDAAEHAFASKGFDGANMREIARAADVNKTMVYYHFKDKQTLFERILDAIYTPVLRQVTQVIAQAPDLESAVGGVFDFYQDLFARRGGRLRPFMARELAVGAPRVSKIFQIKGPEILAHWALKLEAEAGHSIPSPQLELIVFSIMIGIVSGFLMEPAFAPIMEGYDLSMGHPKVREHIIRYIMGGIKARLDEALPSYDLAKGTDAP